MRKGRERATLSDAISEAKDQLYTLSDEMRDMFERTPPHFQDSNKVREEAADDLQIAHDLLGRFDVPKKYCDEEIGWRVMRAGTDGKFNRSAQRNNVVRCLQACAVRLGTLPQDDDDIPKFKAECERAIGLLRGIRFLGMRTP